MPKGEKLMTIDKEVYGLCQRTARELSEYCDNKCRHTDCEERYCPVIVVLEKLGHVK